MDPRLRSTSAHPRAALLTELAEAFAERPFYVLQRLGAVHNGAAAERQEFRQGHSKSLDHLFAAPEDVATLVSGLLVKIGDLLEECEEPRDVFYVAAFAIATILQIHPFQNGNGRTAIDFAQVLLMNLFAQKNPLSVFPDNIHAEIGSLVAGITQKNAGQTREHFNDYARWLSDTILEADLASLKETPAYNAIVHWWTDTA